jgi:hypothetical protein
MIGGGREGSPAGLLYAMRHDHSYARRPPSYSPPSSKGLSLAEVAAAAEMILEQDKMDCESGDGGEEGEEEEEGREQSFCDSGYGGGSDESTEQNLEELGADALLALACGARSP